MRILIIDDSKNNSAILNAILHKEGFENIFTATGLGTALELLGEKRIDLILLSCVLPDISGPKACLQISGNLLYEDIPVIMVTANNDIETLQLSFEHGAIDYIAKPFNSQELIARVQAHLIRKHVSDERKKIAITDPLTYIYNRRHFDTIFDLFYTRALSENKSISFFMLDIDNFKKYNDAYGHLQGDKVLTRLGWIIKSCLRTMDSAYRYGGEEFTVILPETQGKEALIVAPRIRALTEAEKFIPGSGKIVNVTISIGVTEYCSDERVSNFVERADKAMYIAKQQGRNQVASLFI